MIMKKYLLVVIFSIFALPCLGQISTSININGYWGKWSSSNSYVAYGTDAQFIIYDKLRHPSRYDLKVVITNFDFPDAKEKRKHLKTGEWYTYEGYIEYQPQFDDSTKEYNLDAFVHSFHAGYCYYNPGLKKLKAIIKIAPYRKSPQTYNIWFDKYGLGLSFNWGK